MPLKKSDSMVNEIQLIKDRYERRGQLETNRYSALNPSVYMAQQEKERVVIAWIKREQLNPLANKRLLEVGCGNGSNLLEMIKLDFKPENIIANELLEGRAITARQSLPENTKVLVCDAMDLELKSESFDIVYQSTVFTSILDKDFQLKLASKLWNLVKPNGYFLWYDFIYDNPQNNDVKGISLKRVHELFPNGKVNYRKISTTRQVSHVADICKKLNVAPFAI